MDLPPTERRTEEEPHIGPLGRLALYIPCWIFVTYVVAGVIMAALLFLDGALRAGMEAREFASIAGEYIGPIIFVTDALQVAVTLGFLWIIDRKSLRDIGLDWSPGRALQLVVGFLIGAAFVAVMLGSYRLAGWMRFEPVEPNWLGWVLSTLLVYPMIGFAEELVFRGYLMTNLEEWRGRGTAIAVSSVLFWMVHLGGDGNVAEPMGIAAMLATGVVFAIARYGSGGLWLPIGLHAAYDWVAVSLIGYDDLPLPGFLKADTLVEPWLVGPPGHAGVADLLWALGLLVAVYFLFYRGRATAQFGEIGKADTP